MTNAGLGRSVKPCFSSSQLFALCLVLLAGVASVPPSFAAITGQWDFETGDLSATIGSPLTYRGTTAAGTQFGTTTSFGIADINGQPSKVMKFPACLPAEGYLITHGAAPNGGGTHVNQYTLIMDVLFASAGLVNGSFLQTDTSNTTDGDLFVSPANGIGITNYYHGNLTPNAWHRVAFTVDLAKRELGKFIDGTNVLSGPVGVSPGANPMQYLDPAEGGVDQRWALVPAALLLADDNGETRAGYVNSIQFRDSVLSPAQIAVLGGATEAGIPYSTPTVTNPIADFTVEANVADRVINLLTVFHDAVTPAADLVYSVQANSNPALVSATTDNVTDKLKLQFQLNQHGSATITVRATGPGAFYVDDTFVLTVNWPSPGCVLEESVLDNFDDNTKTDWQDFTVSPGFGLPVEHNGQFDFAQPPAGQAIFSASWKTSRVFDLRECGRLRFSVDLVTGNGKDSFAILAFIPTNTGPLSLFGYGLGKSTTDILISKGINKYFYNENVSPPVKNENVTLVLDLSVSNANSVVITGRVLDKDDNNAVIWEQTFADTPDPDVLADGEDNPAAPFITAGHFTLYLYQDFDQNLPQAEYQVIYDNAKVLAPVLVPNQPPMVANPIVGINVSQNAPDTVIDLGTVFQDAVTPDSDLVYSVQANSNPALVSATADNTGDSLTLHYQPNQTGTATITVRATDAAGLYAEDSFVVTVNVSPPARITVRKNSDETITLEWSGDAPGELRNRPSLGGLGTWSPIAGAASPYTFTPSLPTGFFVITDGSVYSANVVGYVKLSLRPGLNLIQNPLDAAAAGGNTVSNILAGVPDGTTVYRYTNTLAGSGFIINDYSTLFGWSDANMSMSPGEGVLVFLPGASDITRVFIGDVPQGLLIVPLAPGLNLVGSKVPEAGMLQADLKYTPIDGDLAFTFFNSTGYTINSYDDQFGWVPTDPHILAGEALWIRTTAARAWDRSFSATVP